MIEHIDLYGWSCIRMSEGPLSIALAPSIGGRIISIVFEGRELLFVNDAHRGETFDFSKCVDLDSKKRELGFRLWGGDKTWISPQSQWSQHMPPLELDAGQYALTWNQTQAIMTSPICRETGLQITRRVRLENGIVLLEEEICNCSTSPVRRGIWNVTQILRPLRCFIPAQAGAIRSYHKEDPTLDAISEDFHASVQGLEIPCLDNQLFKVGGIPSQGYVLTHIGNPVDIAWERLFDPQPGAAFAHNSSVEVYNSRLYDYAEVEVHSPLVTLQPGDRNRLVQQWRFFRLPVSSKSARMTKT